MTVIDHQPDAHWELRLRAGIPVEVQNRFDGTWSRGFAIEELVGDGSDAPPACRIRRISDGVVLPAVVPRDRVRPQR